MNANKKRINTTFSVQTIRLFLISNNLIFYLFNELLCFVMV